jgi:excisionase family DNA binding protein
MMQNYLTPEEIAQKLKVEVAEIMSLVEQGKLKAIRIGSSIRVPEIELERMLVTCPAVDATEDLEVSPATETEALTDGSRWCLTRTGRARFRVSGSVADGADIWPGKMPYPIKFPKEFMDAMLAHFRDQEIAVGGKFDDPGSRSLGEFIQQRLKIKMNPAVYVAALLIDEGYADAARRGYIRFRSRSRQAERAD